jgi:hypothetical protein
MITSYRCQFNIDVEICIGLIFIDRDQFDILVGALTRASVCSLVERRLSNICMRVISAFYGCEKISCFMYIFSQGDSNVLSRTFSNTFYGRKDSVVDINFWNLKTGDNPSTSKFTSTTNRCR